ncbi:UNC93-like protein MFSD11 [Euwallacea fornicatus]|uniref:UNC93-like protein MFSD11 n=1 Tax=Euwallacea fornicatus TaxID=995702 RepID=UPI00339057BA
MDRGFINVLLLGLAFMLVFTAFQTWTNIQKTIIDSIKIDDTSFKDANAYSSLAIIYISMAIFNWNSPSVISLIGPRVAMLIGGITYVLFVMSFFIPYVWLLYLVSCIMGIGAALIWTGQGNYLTLNSNEQTISRNSGIFWAMLQMSMFIGNTFVFFVFRDKENIDRSTRQIVIWTLSAIAVSGLAVMVFFPKPVHTEEKLSTEISETAISKAKLALKRAGRLFCTRNMILLCLTFVYTGLELGFWSGVYGYCISTTKVLPNSKRLMGISGIFIGLGEVIAGAAFGILGSKTNKWGRDPIVILGFILHVVSFFVIFLNIPNNAPFKDTPDQAFITSNAVLAIMCSFLLGFGDACFNTQIFSMLGGVYVEDSVAAFSIFKFTQSVGAAISLTYASYFYLYAQLGILLVFAIMGTVSFVWVEWRHKRPVVNAEASVSDSE